MKARNLEVGEVVLLRYPGQFKSDYTLAKVVEAHPSAEGLVRQVSVQFRKRSPLLHTRRSLLCWKRSPDIACTG